MTEGVFVSDRDVLGTLEVSVYDLVVVEVGHAVRDLPGPLVDLGERETGAALQELEERAVLAVLHHHAVARRLRAHAAEPHCAQHNHSLLTSYCTLCAVTSDMLSAIHYNLQ